MQVQEHALITVEKGKIITRHSYRPVLKLFCNKEKEHGALSVEQLRTPEEQEVCCMATD